VLNGTKHFRLLAPRDTIALKARSMQECDRVVTRALREKGRKAKPSLLFELCPSIAAGQLIRSADQVS